MRRVLWLVLLGSVVGLASGSIDPAEFECEEAVAHIESCCNSKVNVTCGGTCEDVQLTLDNSVCLRKASCDSIVSSGACDDPAGVACR